MRDWRVVERDVQRLLHRLVDRLVRQAEQRADAGRLRRAEMGDVVESMWACRQIAHQVATTTRAIAQGRDFELEGLRAGKMAIEAVDRVMRGEGATVAGL